MPIPRTRVSQQVGFHLLALVLLVAGLPAPAIAQPTLRIVVAHANGRVAAQLDLQLARVGTGDTWHGTTTDLGICDFTVPPGRYRLTIDVSPFEPVTREFDVRPHMREAVTIRLELTGAEHITVAARAATGRRPDREPGLGTLFSRQILDTLPLRNGRALQAFTSLVPGIIVTDSIGTLAQFTAVGQRRFANRLTIDGLNADLAIDVRGQGVGEAGGGSLPATATLGGTQTLVPLEAIETIDVRTVHAAPEYARSPGAQIGVTTRAGGARTAGSAFLDVRPDRLAARDWFANAGLAPRRTTRYGNGGASIGGPLPRTPLFYFASWERQQIDRPLDTVIRVPSLRARDLASPEIRAILDAFPRPNRPELDDDPLVAEYAHLFPSSSSLDVLSVRADAVFSPRHRLFVRVNGGRSRGDEIDAELRLPRLSFSHLESTTTRTVTIGETSQFGGVTHDVRMNLAQHEGALVASAAPYGGAQRVPVELLAAPGADSDDVWVRATLFRDGTIQAGRTGASEQKQIAILDTWTMTMGRHEWRFGGDYRGVRTSTDPARLQYVHNAPNLTFVLQNQPRPIVVAASELVRMQRDAWALFAQDTVRITERLSLIYGLRYSGNPAPTSRTRTHPLIVAADLLPALQPEPSGSPLWTSSRALAPQLAATWRIGDTPGRDAIIRGGWSLVFDELTGAGAVPYGRAFPFVSSGAMISALPVRLNGPLPVPAGSFEASVQADAYAVPDRFRRPRTHQWHLGVDRSLGANRRVSLAYVGAAGRDLTYGQGRYVRDTGHLVHVTTNAATSDYHALLTEYVSAVTRGVRARVAYTWGHAIDTDSGEGGSPNSPVLLLAADRNRGSADFDRRHVLAAVASYEVPPASLPPSVQWLGNGWRVSVAALLESGAPFSVTTKSPAALYATRPSLVPDVQLWLDNLAVPGGRQLNEAAFTAGDAEADDAVGRNVFRASPLRQVDLSLSRTLRLHDRAAIHLRLDVFNVLNLANFGPPEGRLDRPTFGVPVRSYADALGTGTLSRGGLTPIQQVGASRSIQLGIRVDF